MTEEAMTFDVVIVGAGIAGLSAAIKLKQLSSDISVCVIEKGSEVGAHILSGAIFEPRPLNELIPNWEQLNAPLHTLVRQEQVLLLTKNQSWNIPSWLLPPQLDNQGNYIISLGNLCRWLAEQAENLGVEIYPGFAATKVLFNEDGSVKGILTGDMGLDKNSQPKLDHELGLALYAKYTLFAEGCRGLLSEQLIQHFKLCQASEPPSYALGIKELWEVDPTQHQAGRVIHTFGWPLDGTTHGGAFIYHLEKNQVALGLIVGLDYKNPYLHPFKELQRFKMHPAIRTILEGGRRISYGARTLNRGGLQSIPELVFPGGVLLGCAAGFLNIAKLKGCHTAMKSGMLAAEAIIESLHPPFNNKLINYHHKIQTSWLYDELYQVRNSRPAYARWGILGKIVYEKILRGKEPFTLRHNKADHQYLKTKTHYKPIVYPKPDNKISFDLLSSVALSNTYHEEDQPVHLQLRDPTIPILINLVKYDAPEQRYCPAGVYEIVEENMIKNTTKNTNLRLQINAANCLHCKACEIKDPHQNITWTSPEGGGGPNYPNM